MAASASPRKPMVATDSRSVGWRSCWWRGGAGPAAAARRGCRSRRLDDDAAHAAAISLTDLPGAGVERVVHQLAHHRGGRSTTSPAAIWLISSSGSSRMPGRRARWAPQAARSDGPQMPNAARAGGVHACHYPCPIIAPSWKDLLHPLARRLCPARRQAPVRLCAGLWRLGLRPAVPGSSLSRPAWW